MVFAFWMNTISSDVQLLYAPWGAFLFPTSIVRSSPIVSLSNPHLPPLSVLIFPYSLCTISFLLLWPYAVGPSYGNEGSPEGCPEWHLPGSHPCGSFELSLDCRREAKQFRPVSRAIATNSALISIIVQKTFGYGCPLRFQSKRLDDSDEVNIWNICPRPTLQSKQALLNYRTVPLLLDSLWLAFHYLLKSFLMISFDAAFNGARKSPEC